MNNQQLVAFLKKNLACRPALEWLQARTLKPGSSLSAEIGYSGSLQKQEWIAGGW